jgi:hypothetical protein
MFGLGLAVLEVAAKLVEVREPELAVFEAAATTEQVEVREPELAVFEAAAMTEQVEVAARFELLVAKAVEKVDHFVVTVGADYSARVGVPGFESVD